MRQDHDLGTTAFEQRSTSVSCFVDWFTTRLEKTVLTMPIRERLLADVREVIVVQLRLLDLMVRRRAAKTRGNGRSDTRAALIDLMARVVVAVFQGGGVGGQ